jgi:ABC-type multidrug transport system fused ATPase/permease subunit
MSNNIKLFNKLSKRRKLQLFGLLILMFIASIAEIISISAILPFLGILTNPQVVFNNNYSKPFLELFKINNPNELLFPVTIFFVTAISFSGMIRIMLMWIQIELSYAIGRDLSIDIYSRSLFQPYDIQISRNSSQIISAIANKVNAVVSATIQPILNIVGSSFLLFLIISTLIFVNFKITFFTFLTFGFIYLIIILITKKKLKYLSKIVNNESNHVIKALQEGLGGIRDILIDGSQSTYIKQYKNSDVPLRKAQSKIAIISGIPRLIVETIGLLLISIISYFFITNKQIDASESIVPILGLIALSAQKLLPILQQYFLSWTSIKGNEAVLDEILKLLNQPFPDFSNNHEDQAFTFNNQIKIADLKFRYTNNSELILENVNLTIKKGSIIGIVGKTGGGKSTLIDLIMGLLTPTSGALMVDNVTITNKNSRFWQKKIAHVPQNIFLSDASIKENIAFGIEYNLIDIDKVIDCAKKAQLYDSILSWEHKFDTIVGERGVRLSGGQRQRIGIARALYRKSELIVFDEATSALDEITEKEVLDAIDKLDKNLTIIIIAHRLSTLKNCSEIYSIDQKSLSKFNHDNKLITL